MLVRPAARPFTALTFLRDVAIGLSLWLLLIFVVGEGRVVPTGSMEPSIRVGDRIWTDKIGLRFGQVERGDVVVFNPPVAAETQYLKRVVGLPGETVEVREGQVWVNGQALPEPYITEAPEYQYGPVTIGANQYLVLGDNRNHSHDSHHFGLIRRDQITARAVYRFWPFDGAGALRP